ncbi:sulfotransferase 1C4-like [Panulirus ornatus]|uniref:sulfotransferase 1C4-like n=1 Tax=Panulirus ornatus TaxID=150431 RepID=UPI003A837BE2
MSDQEPPTTENVSAPEQEAPTVMSEQEPAKAESEVVAAEVVQEAPAPAVVSEQEPVKTESVIIATEVVQEAPMVVSEQEAPPPKIESGEHDHAAVVEETPMVTNGHDEPQATESVSAPEVPAPVMNGEKEPPAPTPTPPPMESSPKEAPPPTIMNGREPPTTETVGAAELTRMVNCGFKNYTKLVRGKPRGPLLPDAYLKFADKLYNFEFRNEDVMVMAFPKSGTTWVSEIVWALTNIDQLHLMDELGVRDRVFWLEKDAVFSNDRDISTSIEMQRFRELYPNDDPEDGVVLKLAAAEKSPRHFFTHLPPQLHNPDMLNKCKVIYVARNPKDVCFSWYNFLRNLPGEKYKEFEGEFAEFVEGFKAGYILYSPYWEHIQEAWQLRHHRNFHFIFYEDLQTDIMGEMRRLSSFLKLGLGDDQLQKVSELTSFQTMKGREDKLPIIKELQTSFFYKGQVGSWDEAATSLVDARMVAWINENLQGTDIRFTFN